VEQVDMSFSTWAIETASKGFMATLGAFPFLLDFSNPPVLPLAPTSLEMF